MYSSSYSRKLRQKDPNSVQVSYLPEELEGQLDNIHEKVERLLSRVRSSSSEQRPSSNYRRMNEAGQKPAGEEAPKNARSADNDF